MFICGTCPCMGCGEGSSGPRALRGHRAGGAGQGFALHPRALVLRMLHVLPQEGGGSYVEPKIKTWSLTLVLTQNSPGLWNSRGGGSIVCCGAHSWWPPAQGLVAVKTEWLAAQNFGPPPTLWGGHYRWVNNLPCQYGEASITIPEVQRSESFWVWGTMSRFQKDATYQLCGERFSWGLNPQTSLCGSHLAVHLCPYPVPYYIINWYTYVLFTGDPWAILATYWTQGGGHGNPDFSRSIKSSGDNVDMKSASEVGAVLWDRVLYPWDPMLTSGVSVGTEPNCWTPSWHLESRAVVGKTDIRSSKYSGLARGEKHDSLSSLLCLTQLLAI